MAINNLKRAKRIKNDEFYTQWKDIEKEVLAYINYNPDVFKNKTILLPCDDPETSNFTKFFARNFETFGLKKLVSTSYAYESKNFELYCPHTPFEQSSPCFDINKAKIKGRIFTLDYDTNKNRAIDIEKLEWDYLDGNGDFRSDEVKKLRDEADIIITNPPFSLFREFLAWVIENDKQFIIIGSKNCITYKEVFPLLKENKVWIGTTSFSKDMLFIPPFVIDSKEFPRSATRIVKGTVYFRSPAVWFTNIEHGRRHQPLQLMTMAENIKYSKHKEIKGGGYQKYDNYDAIEVPFTDAIPSDYNGIMGVPISFLDKYCPEQVEILGDSRYHDGKTDAEDINIINGKVLYRRILIKKRG